MLEVGCEMHEVAVVKYEKPFESVRSAVDLVGGLGNISRGAKVFIKPNFCLWREGINFPKYGVLTTARLIEDVVVLLKEHGATDITIAEGVVEIEKRPESTLQLVARGIGLDAFAKRNGVKLIDVLGGSFSQVGAGDVKLAVNKEFLEADYIVNMPVLKTHSQAMVSLGIKNLKGLLSIASRKRCHNTEPGRGLDYHLAKLAGLFSPSLTIMDGIYTLERGPLYTGRAHRSNVIIASKDLISGDKVGSTMLGIAPQTVPYIAQAAKDSGRPADLSDILIKGTVDIKTVLKPHEWEFGQNESGDLPLFFERAGIGGMTYPQADKTMCTYCADFIYYVIWGILLARNRDKPFDDIEVLHGKVRRPSGSHKHTLLVGQCQVKLNGDNPLIRHCVRIKGCPPSRKDLLEAYREVGIELPDDFLERMERMPESFLGKYLDNPDFDEAFYKMQ